MITPQQKLLITLYARDAGLNAERVCQRRNKKEVSELDLNEASSLIVYLRGKAERVR
jgi:cell division inhibitor SulA